MKDTRTGERSGQFGSGGLWPLGLLAAVSWCAYGAIAVLSVQFSPLTPGADRPIVAVLGLFAVALGCYFLAIGIAARADQGGRLLGLIVAGAVIFRVTLLASVPIQEIDIYRYLWDGAVTNNGVSPFRYSPQQVQEASSDGALADDLAGLVRLRDSSPELAAILGRIHFGQLPTIYPPTSQAVFAAATLTTPKGAGQSLRLFIMKTWFVALDLATLALVVALLKLAGRPVGLCLIYGWCPLLMKEVANSGHLDAVAVFLATLAVYLAARVFFHPAGGAASQREAAAWGWSTAAAVVLALAVGAKLYPIVLAPLLLMGMARRLGWRRAIVPAAVFCALTLLVLWPMMPTGTGRLSATASWTQPDTSPVPTPVPTPVPKSMPALPTTEVQPAANDPSLGLVTFLGRWEMNDFIFLLLIENLKPAANVPAGQIAWFSVVPESLRAALATGLGSWLNIDPGQMPFIVARGITLAAFVAVAGWLAWRTSATDDATRWLGAAFLTVAWFWLLCPTQNPWYWTWALPLLPFARGRAWLAVSGLVLLYYLRFWLMYRYPTEPVWGTPYVGFAFFNFVLTWLEFAPWFIWLAIERRRLAQVEQQGTTMERALAA